LMPAGLVATVWGGVLRTVPMKQRNPVRTVNRERADAVEAKGTPRPCVVSRTASR
jgi:hypothetical protein